MKSECKRLSPSHKVLKEVPARRLLVGLLLNPLEVRLGCDPIFVVRRNRVGNSDTRGYRDETGFY